MIRRTVEKLEKVYSNELFFKLYSLPYKEVIKREIELGRITSKDVVLNVGCGAVPFSAIHIANIADCTVYALDKDKEAIDKACKLVSTLQLKDKIDFIVGDATYRIPQKYDIAVVALQVEPKKEVLENLLKNADSVIMRLPRKGLQNIYGHPPDQITPTKEVKHRMPTFDRSVLYKNPNHA